MTTCREKKLNGSSLITFNIYTITVLGFSHMSPDCINVGVSVAIISLNLSSELAGTPYLYDECTCITDSVIGF